MLWVETDFFMTRSDEVVDDVGTGRAATGVAEPLIAGKTFHDATGRMNTTIPAQISICSKSLLKKIVHLR